MRLSSSIMAALEKNISLEKALAGSKDCDLMHVDIMDGVFVGNKSDNIFTKQTVKKIRKIKPVDMHLMVINPKEYINDYGDICEMISFHIESPSDTKENIDMIKEIGSKVGIVLNPDTPVKKIEPFLKSLDFVLVMTVNPGKSGQPFMPGAVMKIKELKKLKMIVEVDGSINEKTLDAVREADIAVLGSAIFNENPIIENVGKIKALVM